MTARFTPLVLGDIRLRLRVEFRDMEEMELFNQPLSQMFHPISFLTTAPIMVRQFAKDESFKPFFKSDEEALSFVKAFVDINKQGAYVGYSALYTHLHMALINSGWLTNPLEDGDINAPAPKSAPDNPKMVHEIVFGAFEPLLLEYGLQFEEISRMTPAEAKSIVVARSKRRMDDLRSSDLMNSGVMQAIYAGAGCKNVERSKLLTFEIHSPKNECEYVYGPGETLVSDVPTTQEELIEQTVHLTEMKRRFRCFTGAKNEQGSA